MSRLTGSSSNAHHNSVQTREMMANRADSTTVTTTALIPPSGVLRLSGEAVPEAAVAADGEIASEADTNTTERRRIRWDDSVVDNENLNRQKSKICCIFKKRRQFDESSSDESSSSSSCCSSSDEGSSKQRTSRRRRHRHRSNRSPSPNAYEKAPRYHKKPSAASTPKDDLDNHQNSTPTIASSSNSNNNDKHHCHEHNHDV
ncbi:phosphatase inhibitor-domain-containing protein [Syncephalis fuscata]|nr:phosphatase inhibitor-domain-containing protein [Syncephalis fuscata]